MQDNSDQSTTITNYVVISSTRSEVHASAAEISVAIIHIVGDLDKSVSSANAAN